MAKIPVSVVVATKNESARIAECLRALEEFKDLSLIRKVLMGLRKRLGSLGPVWSLSTGMGFIPKNGSGFWITFLFFPIGFSLWMVTRS